MSYLLYKMMQRAKLAPKNDDGSDNGGGAVATGRNDARLALMESMAEQVDSDRGEDYKDINDDDTLSAFSGAEVETEPTEQEQAEQQAAELEAVQITDQPRIVRKVNGVDVEITDEMIAKAQKVAAADQLLADAKRMHEEALAKTPKPAPAAEPTENQDDTALAFIQAIQMGTPEEALAAYRSLMGEGPSQDDISRTIDARMDQKAAVSKFNAEYSDIVSDSVLSGWANDLDRRMIANGDSRSYTERYTEIGNTIRTWLESKVPATSQANQNDKQQRKAAAPAVVKPAGGKAVPVNEEETEESYSDIVAKMANARGGPQWMNGRVRNS